MMPSGQGRKPKASSTRRVSPNPDPHPNPHPNPNPCLLLQAPTHFAMVDTANGLQVLNFDGRLISQPRFQGMQPELLSTVSMAYAADTLAIIDAADTKCVLDLYQA